MNNKYYFIIASVLFMSNPIYANKLSKVKQDLPEAAYRPYAQNYRDMALVFCIGKAYESEPKAFADAMSTYNGIDNWSSYDLENSTGEIPKLVSKYLARDYHSIHGPNIKLNLFKCIDMYHSKELAELVKRYVPDPNRTYQEDYPDN